MNLKKKVKKYFSLMPYNVQRLLVLPYVLFINREAKNFDKSLMKYIEIDQSIEKSFAKFKKLIEYAYEYVPYYRKTWSDIGLTPDAINTYADINKIPVIDKSTVIKHYDEFISNKVDKNTLTIHSTGGSSGLSLSLLYDDNMVHARRLGILRWMRYAGLDRNDKGVWIGRASESLMQDKNLWGMDGGGYYGFFNPISNRLQLTTNNMKSDVLEHYVENIKKFKPNYIQGYASGIVTLARYMETKCISYPLKAVLSSSEILVAADRNIIEKVFQCKVFDRYGCGEEVVSAIECDRHDGYHIEIDRCYAEVIDENGKIVENQFGNIVGTNLINFAFPLIRYKIGDLGSIRYDNCDCGRKTPIIFNLVGRNSEYLMSKNYIRQYSAIISSHIIMPKEILAYQIEQLTLNEFIVRFCSNSEDDLTNEVMQAIKQVAKTILNIDSPIIKVEQCENIPVSINGKMKYLITHVQ